MTQATKHVAVLMGGLSAERPVSLVSGKACADALESAGYRVSRIDAGRDLAAVLSALKPDVALNCLHGGWGENGGVQGLLEILQIPYSHSGVLASALAMDKNKAKAVLAVAGIPVPGGGLYPRHEIAANHVIAPPYIVKPNAEGSSVGVIWVMEGANRPPAEVLDGTVDPASLLLVEPYIAGRELQVSVLDDGNGANGGPHALAVTDIITPNGMYDYAAKYEKGGSEHIIPADIPAEVTQRIMDLAIKAHIALGCRGVTRSDFRYDATGAGLVLLEVNTQPGMTLTSHVPEQAAHCGISFTEIVEWLVRDASLNR